LLNGTIE